jgi:hypothetical protein
MTRGMMIPRLYGHLDKDECVSKVYDLQRLIPVKDAMASAAPGEGGSTDALKDATTQLATIGIGGSGTDEPVEHEDDRDAREKREHADARRDARIAAILAIEASAYEALVDMDREAAARQAEIRKAERERPSTPGGVEAPPRVIEEAPPEVVGEAPPEVVGEAPPKVVGEAHAKVADQAGQNDVDMAEAEQDTRRLRNQIQCSIEGSDGDSIGGSVTGDEPMTDAVDDCNSDAPNEQAVAVDDNTMQLDVSEADGTRTPCPDAYSDAYFLPGAKPPVDDGRMDIDSDDPEGASEDASEGASEDASEGASEDAPVHDSEDDIGSDLFGDALFGDAQDYDDADQPAPRPELPAEEPGHDTYVITDREPDDPSQDTGHVDSAPATATASRKAEDVHSAGPTEATSDSKRVSDGQPTDADEFHMSIDSSALPTSTLSTVANAQTTVAEYTSTHIQGDSTSRGAANENNTGSVEQQEQPDAAGMAANDRRVGEATDTGDVDHKRKRESDGAEAPPKTKKRKSGGISARDLQGLDAQVIPNDGGSIANRTRRKNAKYN